MLIESEVGNETGKQELRKQPKLISETAGCRVYEDEIIHEEDGSTVVKHLCEELIDGRWEGFYIEVKRTDDDGKVIFPRPNSFKNQ